MAEFDNNITEFSTPKRENNFYRSSVVIANSPPIRENNLLPWNWSENMVTIKVESPSANSVIDSSPDVRGSEGKRGRPRADVINTLIHEGSQSPSSIKCNICNRVFPREKSLQAHLRTHTGMYRLHYF